MLLQLFTTKAEKYFPKRWLFLGISIIGMASVFSFFYIENIKSILPVTLLVPFIVVPWGFLCMCSWFHPTKGKLYVGFLTSKLPPAIQNFVRWYAAIFLVLFFIIGLFVFPILGIVENFQ